MRNWSNCCSLTVTRIADALRQVVAEGKYTMVLTEAALSPLVAKPIADNLSIRVAMKMKLPLPKEVEDAFRAATGGWPLRRRNSSDF
jgi:hypothetical protein